MRLVALLFALFLSYSSALVIGLDYGSLYLKASLVKPGTLGEIILNEQSQRKTPVAVGFYKGDRYFGVDAMKLQTFVYAAELLGRNFSHPLVEEIKNFYPRLPELDPERGTYRLRLSDNETFTPEEIVAMMLKKVKDLSGGFTDTVVTIPPWLTQHERQALIQAAELADLNILALLHSGTAWAIGYGITRTFEEPTRIMFLDPNNNKTYTLMSVEGLGWDRTLGGRMFDEVLALRFATKAAAKIGEETVRQPKVWQKLLSEAQKVKEILSANQETPVNIEGLTNEFDFKDHITRAEYEALCGGLLDRVTAPIETALKMAGVQSSDLAFVEIAGGGIRVPRVQAIVKQVLGRAELDRHINGDEGAVQGAAFYAALQSPLFKVKDFRVRDLTSYPVGVSLATEGEPLKQTTLFLERNRFGSKKTLSFATGSNFSMHVAYTDPEHLPAGSAADVALHQLHGLPTAPKYNFTGLPKVSCTFRLTDGSVLLQDCDAEVNVTVMRAIRPPPKPKVIKEEVKEDAETKEDSDEAKSEQEPEAKSEEAKESDKSAAEPEEEEKGQTEEKEKSEQKDDNEEEREEKEEKAEGSDDEEEEEEKDEEEEEEIQYKEVVLLKKLRLQADSKTLGVRPMSSVELMQARSRLNQIRRKEDEKKELEKERNNLESWLYATRDRLQSKVLIEVSTEAEREAISQSLAQTGDWLDYEAGGATSAEFRKKLREVREPFDRIESRAAEKAGRSEAVASFQKYIETTHKHLATIPEKYQVEQGDVDEVIELCDKTTAWLQEKLSEQAQLAAHQDPAFTLQQLMDKSKAIDKLVRVLARKPLKKVKKNVTVDGKDKKSKGEKDEKEEKEEQQPEQEERQEEQQDAEAEPEVEVEEEEPAHDSL